VDESRLRVAIEVLEELSADPAGLAGVDDGLRRRLVVAAGQLSRPDRYVWKALAKAIVRDHKRARRVADNAVLERTGIRALRKEPVFRATLPLPDQALDAPVRDDPEPDEAVDGWAEAEARRAEPATGRVRVARHCYVCKANFRELHHFYDQLCNPCGELNCKADPILSRPPRNRPTAASTYRNHLETLLGISVPLGIASALMRGPARSR
jgi:hypothetical protein